MRIDIKQRGVELTSEQLASVTQRIRLALQRFAHDVASVTVTLLDINGPRGGRDKVARVRLRTRQRGAVQIEETDSEVLRALTYAIDRVRRSFVRDLGRQRANAV